MEVHEHPIVEGSVGEIKAPIEHNDFRGVSKFIDRHRQYAIWESHCARLLQNANAETWIKLTGRQRFKYRHIHKWWYPSRLYSKFLQAYLFKAGFLDGAAGFHYAFYKAWYLQTVWGPPIVGQPTPPALARRPPRRWPPAEETAGPPQNFACPTTIRDRQNSPEYVLGRQWVGRGATPSSSN